MKTSCTPCRYVRWPKKCMYFNGSSCKIQIRSCNQSMQSISCKLCNTQCVCYIISLDAYANQANSNNMNSTYYSRKQLLTNSKPKHKKNQKKNQISKSRFLIYMKTPVNQMKPFILTQVSVCFLMIARCIF